MKTAPCPVCNMAISREAETCPHCGHPLVAKQSWSDKLIIIVVCFGVIYLAVHSLYKYDQNKKDVDRLAQQQSDIH